jgi:hypothetical protein
LNVSFLWYTGYELINRRSKTINFRADPIPISSMTGGHKIWRMGLVGEWLKVDGLLISEMTAFVGSWWCKFKMSFHFCECVFKNYILIGRSFYILFVSLKNTHFIVPDIIQRTKNLPNLNLCIKIFSNSIQLFYIKKTIVKWFIFFR